MRILPRKETFCFVYPLVVGQLIISAGQTMPGLLLFGLAASVIVCLILDIKFLVVQFKKLMGGK
jgi:hypothetical protein